MSWCPHLSTTCQIGPSAPRSSAQGLSGEPSPLVQYARLAARRLPGSETPCSSRGTGVSRRPRLVRAPVDRVPLGLVTSLYFLHFGLRDAVGPAIGGSLSTVQLMVPHEVRARHGRLEWSLGSSGQFLEGKPA